jgi:signal transduction histidine kinase
LQHGGIITAEGAPGGGTRVWIHIPDQSDSNEMENTSSEFTSGSR